MSSNIQTTPAQPATVEAGMAPRRGSLLWYVILAFVLTWAIWFPSLAAARGLLAVDVPLAFTLLGNFGPAVAAVIVTAAYQGRHGVALLLGGLLRWRASVKWYLLALAPLAVYFAAFSAYALMSGRRPELGLATWATLAGTYLFWLVAGGPLGEEIGWRGYALPRLQRQHSALTSSLLLAAIWFAWHLPRYLVPDSGGVPALLLFAVQAVAFSVLLTWLYNNSGASLLLVMLLHASINALPNFLPVLYPGTAAESADPNFVLLYLASNAVFVIWAIAVVLRYGAADLAHGAAR